MNLNLNNDQGQSYYYVLKNNGAKPTPTGKSHWLELMPNHLYCFLPSYEADVGKVKVYDFFPKQLVDFKYAMEILEVRI